MITLLLKTALSTVFSLMLEIMKEISQQRIGLLILFSALP